MKKLILVLSLVYSLNALSQVHTLKESIYFSIGKSSLNAQHKAKLDSVVILLKASKKYVGEIKGYTCNIGSTSMNRLISNLRALNVYNYLVDRGANRNNFTYAGYASSNPVGNNNTSTGRAMNRRTDIEIILSLFDDNNGVIADENGTSQSSSGNSTGTSSSSNSGSSNSKGTTTNTKNGTGSKNTSTEVANKTFVPAVELGPEFVSGKIPMLGDKRIKSTNGILIDIDKNTFVTDSKEPIEVDFKDYTQNYDIIKKGLQTKSNGQNLKLLGAFTANFSQDYQELSVNSTKPLKVLIPGEYDPEIKLYSNHRNWQVDTVNKFTYNQEKKAYEVSVINNSQMIGLLKPITDTIKYLKIKIKGLDPDLIKPYIIYDNCLISNGARLKGKFFIFPITQISQKYRLRAQHIDYSSKTPEYYSLDFDITDLSPVGKVKELKENDIIYMRYPSKIEMKKEKLMHSSLCEQSQPAQ